MAATRASKRSCQRGSPRSPPGRSPRATTAVSSRSPASRGTRSRAWPPTEPAMRLMRRTQSGRTSRSVIGASEARLGLIRAANVAATGVGPTRAHGPSSGELTSRTAPAETATGLTALSRPHQSLGGLTPAASLAGHTPTPTNTPIARTHNRVPLTSPSVVWGAAHRRTTLTGSGSAASPRRMGSGPSPNDSDSTAPLRCLGDPGGCPAGLGRLS